MPCCASQFRAVPRASSDFAPRSLTVTLHEKKLADSLAEQENLCSITVCLREFACELTSSLPPAREDGRSRAAVRGQDPGDPGDPRDPTGSADGFFFFNCLLQKSMVCVSDLRHSRLKHNCSPLTGNPLAVSWPQTIENTPQGSLKYSQGS